MTTLSTLIEKFKKKKQLIKLGMIGLGYVGTILTVGFAKKGFTVFGYDNNPMKLEQFKSGKISLFENGITDIFYQLRKAGKIVAKCKIEDLILESDIIYVCVGTPSQDSGHIELKYVNEVVDSLATCLSTTKRFKIIIIKSTIVPETTRGIIKPKLNNSLITQKSNNFALATIPEFLREGNGLHDFSKPDRIIIGTENSELASFLQTFYKDFNCPIILTDYTTAELIKYASNSFLAMKISFINEISNLCESIGTDIEAIINGLGLDARISPKFLKPGVGYGGSCFSKDIEALKFVFAKARVETKLLHATQRINKEQAHRIVRKVAFKLNLKGKRITLLGLTFKAGTNDVRNSQGIIIANELLKRQVTVIGWDPHGIENAKIFYPKPMLFNKDLQQALRNSDAAIILTEWEELANIPYKVICQMNRRLLIDAKRHLKTVYNETVEIIKVGEKIFNTQKDLLLDTPNILFRGSKGVIKLSFIPLINFIHVSKSKISIIRTPKMAEELGKFNLDWLIKTVKQKGGNIIPTDGEDPDIVLLKHAYENDIPVISNDKFKQKKYQKYTSKIVRFSYKINENSLDILS